MSKSPHLSRKTPSPDFSESPSVAINFKIVENHLDISNSQLSKISERQMKALPNLTGITSVDAAGNKFIVLDFLKHLCNLVNVDASRNMIKRLLSFSALKRTMKKLDVSHNQIATTEHFLSQFIRLEYLDISYNLLSTFPAINELTELTHLDISHNNIIKMPTLKRLTNLKTFKMNCCQVSNLTDIADLPPSLTNFEIADNNIQKLVEIIHLKQLPSLKNFSFHGNPAVADSEFNYRPFIVSRNLNIQEVDGEELSKDEQLMAEYIHFDSKFQKLIADENHVAILAFLKVTLPFKNAVEALTPTHPTMQAVKTSFLLRSMENCTPKRACRTADPNVRRISPKRSATGDLSDWLKPLTLQNIRDELKISDDRLSSGSGGTVVMGDPISQALDLECPTVSSRAGSLLMDTDRTTPQPKGDELPLDLAASDINHDMTKILKEPPFSSTISNYALNDDEPESRDEVNILNRTFVNSPEPENLTVTLLDEPDGNVKPNYSCNELEELKNVINTLTEKFNDLNARFETLKHQKDQAANQANALEQFKYFIPMPSNIKVSEMTDSSYTINWNLATIAQPTIQNFAVYVDDVFVSEVSGNYRRIRFCEKIKPGQKITIESISPTGIRSVKGELILHVCEDKENILGDAFNTSRTV